MASASSVESNIMLEDSKNIDTPWSTPEAILFSSLQSSSAGLSSLEAERAVTTYGPNTIRAVTRYPRLRLFASQFKSPIAILLACAAVLSAVTGERFDGMTILCILLASSSLGYWQELRAHNAVQALLKRLERRTSTLRDGTWQTIPSISIVPGDIISLSAGSQIPADCRILSSTDLSVDQSSLTGESFPCDKKPGECPPSTQLGERYNMLFAGCHIVSGKAIAVVVSTGENTEFGTLSTHLRSAPPPTEFELGVRNFGYLLLEVAAALALLVFAINLTYERPILDVLLFTLALVVGMTPQLLPAIATTTLAQGAHRMALKQVVVRRLNSIADLGGISVLCTDKTGTLTEGTVTWEESTLYDGTSSKKTALFAYLNALHETGFSNVIDDTIRASPQIGADTYSKVDEIPYDFTRRLLSITVDAPDSRILITKGAFKEVLERCTSVELADGRTEPLEGITDSISEHYKELSIQGYRCLGVAYRTVRPDIEVSKDLESGLTFLGFIRFVDPIKSTAISSIQALEALGITCKVVTGDNRFTAAKLGKDLGVLSVDGILTGEELETLTDEALRVRVQEVDIFAEVNPHQKERIILTLKKLNLGVGYLGDGINDAAALRAGDVGISVDTATDVTKEAADIVLLNKDLHLLLNAVTEGRMAFANTLKYILVTTSANFGNMFSVAGASLFADFLPMLPPQILLLNVLSDLPAMAIATDKVDPEMTEKPVRWSSKSIASFMLVYGLISSIFDYLTFGILLILNLGAPAFRTGWFIESVISEVLVLLVIRTRRPIWRSKLGLVLALMSALTCTLTVVIPYSPAAPLLGFSALTPSTIGVVTLILFGYISSSELAKRFLSKRAEAQRSVSLANSSN